MPAHYIACSWLMIFGDIWFSHVLTCQLKWSFSREGLIAVWKFFETELFSFQTWFSRPQQTEYALHIGFIFRPQDCY